MLSDTDREDAIREMSKGAPELNGPACHSGEPGPLGDPGVRRDSSDIKSIIEAMVLGGVFVAPPVKKQDDAMTERKKIAEALAKQYVV